MAIAENGEPITENGMPIAENGDGDQCQTPPRRFAPEAGDDDRVKRRWMVDREVTASEERRWLRSDCPCGRYEKF